jgi:hypothetical protein
MSTGFIWSKEKKKVIKKKTTGELLKNHALFLDDNVHNSLIERIINDELIEIRFINDYAHAPKIKKSDSNKEIPDSAYGTLYVEEAIQPGPIQGGFGRKAIVCIMKNTSDRLNYTHSRGSICFKTRVIFVLSSTEDGYIVRQDELVLQVSLLDLWSPNNEERRNNKCGYIICNGTVITYDVRGSAIIARRINGRPYIDNKQTEKKEREKT